MLHFFWNFVTFTIALGVLITVHELGHFLAARFFGVTVERFSIGFGHALWRRLDKYGTEYIIAAIPLGGYVKMLDERGDTVSPERYHETFNHKTIWQRAAIIAAGPLFNFLFAIFAYWLVFMLGMPGHRPIVSDVTPYSIAAQAEILPGMEIKSIDGIETPDWESVRLQIIDKIGNKKTIFGVASFSSPHVEKKILDLYDWSFDSDKHDPVATLGIIPLGPIIEPVLAKIQPGSAAMKAGLQVGDRIVKVDDKQINNWQLFMMKVKDNPGRMLKITIKRQGHIVDIILTPDSKPVSKGVWEGFAGVVPKIIPLPVEYKVVRQFEPLPAMIHAGKKTWQMMRLTASMLGKLIIGDIKLNNLSGPISIAKGAGTSAEHGLIFYIMFLAMLSVNLGIINLFPLPVLDGGYLLFLGIEKLKKRPIPERVQNYSYYIGSILLVLLMSIALFNDFSKLK